MKAIFSNAMFSWYPTFSFTLFYVLKNNIRNIDSKTKALFKLYDLKF